MGPPPIDIDNNERNPSFHVYLPQLEDAASIQSAISEVCELMLHRRIEPKEASALFYAMQVASTNMALLSAGKTHKPAPETSSTQSSDPISRREPSTHVSSREEANAAEPDKTRIRVPHPNVVPFDVRVGLHSHRPRGPSPRLGAKPALLAC
jgi:hypothetical protein